MTRPGSSMPGWVFRPLEEINGLWPGNPCLIMIKTLSHDSAR
jgi:hypothetical protein